MVKKKVGGSKRHEKKSLKVKADTATKQPGSAFAAAGSAGRRGGPPPPGHVKRKMARKLHFLDKLAASQTAAAAAAGGGSGSPACVRVRAGGSGVKKLKAKRRPIKALQDLSTLTEALGDALAASQTKSSNRRVSQGAGPGGGDGAAHQASSKHSRGRAIITAQENARVQQVLAHPLYQADPLAAIRNHLQATLGAASSAHQQPPAAAAAAAAAAGPARAAGSGAGSSSKLKGKPGTNTGRRAMEM